MGRLKIGDVVARKSYGEDVLFKVVDIKESQGSWVATLRGVSCRLEADAPEQDLVLKSTGKLMENRRKSGGHTGRA